MGVGKCPLLRRQIPVLVFGFLKSSEIIWVMSSPTAETRKLSRASKRALTFSYKIMVRLGPFFLGESLR